MAIAHTVGRFNKVVKKGVFGHLAGHGPFIELELSTDVGMARVPAPARVVLRLTRVERFVEMPVLSEVDAS